MAPNAAGVTAGTITVTGNGQTKDVAIAAGDSAKTIAANMNGAIGGLTATASTEVKLGVDAAAIAGATCSG